MEALERELTFLYENAPSSLLKVQTFGGFEVFVDGKPLKFRRSKVKELLAYLVDKRGATATTAEAYAVLFEDAADTISRKSMFRNIVRNLRMSLEAAGAEACCCGDLTAWLWSRKNWTATITGSWRGTRRR